MKINNTNFERKFSTNKVDNPDKNHHFSLNFNDSKINNKIINNFDSKHATFDQLKQFSKCLYQEGRLSLIDHATLIFDPSKSPSSIKYVKSLTDFDKLDYVSGTSIHEEKGHFFTVNNNFRKEIKRLVEK